MDKGAHYFRCDFQVHTPRDPNWRGAGATTDAERQACAEELIAACRAKGVHAVGITDHHDLAFFRYVKEAAERETDAEGRLLAEQDRVVVFPGMELTLGVPCQAILLLDAQFPVELLDQVAQALSITLAPAVEARHAPVARLEHITDFEKLNDELNQREFLRGRFFVMPHVGEGGNSTLLRAGFAAKYKSMPCVGGFVDGAVSQHGAGNVAIVAGRNKEWGNKPIGLFQTSDSRSRDFAGLGSHTTWVKWARPTAEALRQACLARESRLAQEQPRLPDTYLTAVEVSNSRFLGPVVLEFNPQYNALIGGRGTGKSTVLEYLRWALCDQPPAEQDPDLPDFQRRRRELLKNTLEVFGSAVTVSFLKNGIPHVVRRRAGTGELLLKIGDGEFVPCTEVDVRTLLPVHAYSQRQLSSVGVKLNELDRFVHAPIRHGLDQLATRREEVAARLRTVYQEVVRTTALTVEVARIELERTSLGEQIQSLRGNLTALSEDDRRVIDEQRGYERAELAVQTWDSEIARTRDALDGLLSEMTGAPSAAPSDVVPNDGPLSEMHRSLSGCFEECRTLLASARMKLDVNAEAYGLAAYDASRATWQTRHRASLEAYALAKERSAAHEGILGQVGQIEGRLRQVDSLRGEKRRALQKTTDVRARFSALRAEWKGLQRKASELLESQCAALTALSKGLIRARLRRGHRIEAVDDQLRTALRGTKIRAERYERIWSAVRDAGDPLETWSQMLDELETLVAVSSEEGGGTTLPPTPKLDVADFTARERQAIARALTADSWLALAVAELGDLPEFEYRVREGEYIKFSEASAGQQATALMYVLLNQGGPPLVIDQPEDDLDNKVMEEVVEEIWGAKQRRQLIFSSHNANLVVNGDAELVVCCDYRVAGDQSGGQVKLQGAIDIPEINQEITAVMEGGREAFDLRRAKYGF